VTLGKAAIIPLIQAAQPASVSGNVSSQCAQYDFPHWWKLILDSIPDDLIIDPVIRVPEKVSHPTKATPIRSRRYRFSVRSQTTHRLRRDLHLAFYCGFRL
jgi:hypothetical protein